MGKTATMHCCVYPYFACFFTFFIASRYFFLMALSCSLSHIATIAGNKSLLCFDGNFCAMFPITLALSHLTRGAFSFSILVTKENTFSSAIFKSVLVAYSMASIQVAFSGSFAISA